MEFDELNREMRVVNRNFSLAEYGSTWTKMERYLFIEFYNVIKEFYTSKNDENIKAFNSENITIKVPVALLSSKLFNNKNRSQQLMEATKGLMDKTICTISINEEGQTGFYFVNMFTFIKYDPRQDKKNIEVKIPKEIFSEMIPIESFCQLDLKLLNEFNSGNTIRLYEVFKSYAFKKKFSISFIELRKKLGFHNEGKYEEWKYFNAKVLKPAILDINKHKELDIEVSYKKARGSFEIEFEVIQHNIQSIDKFSILSLNEYVRPDDRKLNMLQNKYIDTLINNCNDGTISSPDELKEWIISDLISQQKKQGDEFDWKYSCNAISKQIRSKVYMRPFSHTHLMEEHG